jgi:hypothetical protein
VARGAKRKLRRRSRPRRHVGGAATDLNSQENVMKKMLVLAGAFVVLGVLSGCGSGNADSIMQEQIKATNELADLMGDLKGNDAKIKAAGEKLTKLQADFDKTPKDQQEAAKKAHGLELAAAQLKVAQKTAGGMGDLFKGIGGDLLNKGKDLENVGKEITDKTKKGIDNTGKDLEKAGKDLEKLGKDLIPPLPK